MELLRVYEASISRLRYILDDGCRRLQHFFNTKLMQFYILFDTAYSAGTLLFFIELSSL